MSASGAIRVFALADGLVLVGIERLTERVDDRHPLFRKQGEHLRVHRLDLTRGVFRSTLSDHVMISFDMKLANDDD